MIQIVKRKGGWLNVLTVKDIAMKNREELERLWKAGGPEPGDAYRLGFEDTRAMHRGVRMLRDAGFDLPMLKHTEPVRWTRTESKPPREPMEPLPETNTEAVITRAKQVLKARGCQLEEIRMRDGIVYRLDGQITPLHRLIEEAGLIKNGRYVSDRTPKK